MGQVESMPDKGHEIFGSYKNEKNPRPGYYITPLAVYYRAKKMPTVHIPTFKKLKFGWAIDNRHVYYRGNIVRNAKADSFKMDEAGKAFGLDTLNDVTRKWYKGVLLKN